MYRIKSLVDDFVKIYASPEPDSIYCYSPRITSLSTERLIVTMDLGGPGVINIEKSYIKRYSNDSNILGKAFI